jgi:hypothetical protein
MREFEKIKSDYNVEPTRSVRFVSDAEAARRIPSDKINPNEVIESRGDFNALDGTHPSTQAEADARDAAFLER